MPTNYSLNMSSVGQKSSSLETMESIFRPFIAVFNKSSINSRWEGRDEGNSTGWDNWKVVADIWDEVGGVPIWCCCWCLFGKSSAEVVGPSSACWCLFGKSSAGNPAMLAQITACQTTLLVPSKHWYRSGWDGMSLPLRPQKYKHACNSALSLECEILRLSIRYRPMARYCTVSLYWIPWFDNAATDVYNAK